MELLTRIGLNQLFLHKEKKHGKKEILLAVNGLDSQVCRAHRPSELLDGNSEKQR